MGHPANLFEMQFFVPFDSVFLLYILIFLCNDPAYTTPSECKYSRNAAWKSLRIRSPFTGGEISREKSPTHAYAHAHTPVSGHGSCACREGTVGKTARFLPSLRSVQREREC